jgi:hypothetical protein
VLTAEVWNSVVQVTGETGRPGAGCLVQRNAHHYLVTAKHLLTDERDEVLWLRHGWANGGRAFATELTRLGSLAAPADVAVFEIEPDLLPLSTSPILFASAGLVLSQECFMLGYPQLRSRMGEHTELPLVKRAIISGVEKRADEVAVLYVDTIANPGFSGGPVVLKNHETGQFQIVGIVAGTLSGPIIEPTASEPEPPRWPSGISVVTDATMAMNLVPEWHFPSV